MKTQINLDKIVEGHEIYSKNFKETTEYMNNVEISDNHSHNIVWNVLKDKYRKTQKYTTLLMDFSKPENVETFYTRCKYESSYIKNEIKRQHDKIMNYKNKRR